MDCGLPGAGLPAPDGEVAIAGVDFDGAGCALGSLGSQKDRAATAERVENEIAAALTIPDCIGNQADRLWRGVISPCAGSLDRAGGILPHVRARAAILAELEIV